MKESRNLVTLAQGIGATPWPIEESDDDVDEEELQAALEASKKSENVVSFSVSSSSGTDSLPIPVSHSFASTLPSDVVCYDMPSSSCVTSVSSSLPSFFSRRSTVAAWQGPLQRSVFSPSRHVEAAAGDFFSPSLIMDDVKNGKHRAAAMVVNAERLGGTDLSVIFPRAANKGGVSPSGTTQQQRQRAVV
nr:hypothetical protein Iba_chr11dCG11650 [Ipomoea batatas]